MKDVEEGKRGRGEKGKQHCVIARSIEVDEGDVAIPCSKRDRFALALARDDSRISTF